MFEKLEWDKIADHFEKRRNTHRQLGELFAAGDVKNFARWAVGEEDPRANYSAYVNGLGAKILSENANPGRDIFQLATRFVALSSGAEIPEAVRSAGIRYLGISVGSEIACMLDPARFWVTNRKTLWTHLVLEQGGDFGIANRALQEYLGKDPDSTMAYRKWKAIHSLLEKSMTQVFEFGSSHASNLGIEVGSAKFLWADAIAANLYGEYHG
ncbi:MAG TPA: hypothetical protein VFC39_03210 [Acidobacteriaceae bacterium]|nr:hypothetical protein [Acidobacteriaceae bacterium]